MAARGNGYVALWRGIVFRLLYDALGMTSLPRGSEDHLDAVEEARYWFLDRSQEDDFEETCLWAELDARKVKQAARKLIEARQSGDHTQIPEFWRECFRKNRAPSIAALQDEIDRFLDLM